ncbi:hypothetical protein MRB53_023788 [Persea americana]|uniref:Uncharacterized protein n=1 Tax=Persea americana TaxID=3435 RepID=A0ACC2LAK0_PERAE|nr:hypothetical protein MRB53_023788 [Persea americana]
MQLDRLSGHFSSQLLTQRTQFLFLPDDSRFGVERGLELRIRIAKYLQIHEMKRTVPLLFIIFLALSTETTGDSRSQTVLIRCSTQPEHNETAYVPNFVATMQNISDQIQTRSYGVSVVGSGFDTSYGLAQCYGDLSTADCILCYAQARTLLPQCFPNNGGTIYLDGCFMRAENYSFFDEFKGPHDGVLCGNTSRKGQLFKESATKALSDAIAAAPGNGGYGRASVLATGSANESAYVLADCWKTLNSTSSCKMCLENASASVLGCLPWSEGRALNTGCFLRYSDKDFLNPLQSSSRSRGSIIVMVVAIVSSVIVLVFGLALGVHIWKRRKIQKKRKGANDAVNMVSMLSESSLNFKYSTLEKATGSFDIANKLGQGGFGTVYKGVLADGREVAVKRLFFNNRHRAADFYNEVNIISSVEHKNLVRLLGCSCSGPESLLVYEFLPNQSLDRFIFDFGLARSFQEDKSHISTAIAGTLGYMAPEYLAHGQLTEKADVYSFGVLLIEIVTGRQNNRSKICDYSDSLVIIAWKYFQRGAIGDLIDPNLMLQNYEDNENIEREILRVVHVGLLCVQESPLLRPAMSSVLQMLLKMEEELPTPTNPPFMDEKTMELNEAGIDTQHLVNTTCSVASVSHSSFYPR